MPNPRLLHPILVRIVQIDKATNVVRGRAKEVVRQASRDAYIEIYAQVRRVTSDDPRAMDAGIREEEAGYMIFLTRTLLARSLTLHRGDNVIRIGENAYAETVNLYFTRIIPHAHYPGQRGATLTQAYFSDRQPTRSAG